MAGFSVKRRKLSHSPESSASERVEDNGGIGSDSESEQASDSGPSQPKRARLPALQAKNHGLRSNSAHSGGRASSSEQLMAFTSAGGSSMVALQISDLLADVKPDYERLAAQVEQTLHQVKKIIHKIPNDGPRTAPEAEKFLREEAGVRIPFPNPRPGKDVKYTFQYRQPTRISAVGSVPLHIGIASKDASTIEVALQLPNSIFQEKDFLNHRYFHKRAYYIARVAAGIKTNVKDAFKLSFEYQDGIGSKPVLILEPTDHSPEMPAHANFRIKIVCSISSDLFSAAKTMPAKCCLRANEQLSPTPFYNGCLRSEATVDLHHELLQRTISQCEAFGDVCRLGSLWLRQRGFAGSLGRGGFGPHEWSLVCALLLQSGGPRGRPALSARYTCLQLFKAVLQFLAARDLTDPLLLNGAACQIAPSLSPVLFDGAGENDVLFKMTSWSYQLLKAEARATIEAFSYSIADPFKSIFLKQLDHDALRFDQHFVLDEEALLSGAYKQADAVEMLQSLHSVLSKALGNRVKLIHLRRDEDTSWSVGAPFPVGASDGTRIRIGLLLDPHHANRLVDHGPSAEDQVGAAKFRKFWGEKAELRRFKDGSITESLVWSEEPSVIPQIISYILHLHFGLPSGLLHLVGEQLQRLSLPKNDLLSRNSAFKLVNDSFQSLTSKLRQLEGLPLSIRSVLPASSQLRYASLQCPLTSTPVSPIDILIEFEGSARWPDFLPAIQRTKIAFLVKLSDLLSASDSAISCHVGLENCTSSHSNICFLDIILPSPDPGLLPPIPFRARIHHDRTHTLLQKALSTAASSTRPQLSRALQSFTRDNLATPPHTSALTTLCTRFPTLPATIHLVKSWTASHHLLNQIPEPVLEILAATPYLHPHPSPFPPGSAQTAFLRTLDLIANWDWVADPLVVDLSRHDGNSEDGLTADSAGKLATRFTAWRKQVDPGLNKVVWFVGTNVDETGVVWTQGGRPSRVVAARITALARASVEMVKGKNRRQGRREKGRQNQRQNGSGEVVKKDEKHVLQGGDWKRIFQSPLTDFDFVIHLKKSIINNNIATSQTHPEAATKFKNLSLPLPQHKIPTKTKEHRLTFNPVQLYLQDLNNTFNHNSSHTTTTTATTNQISSAEQQNILFFHGDGGGGGGSSSSSSIIAGLWNPKILNGKREWRVRLGYSSVPLQAAGAGATKKQSQPSEPLHDNDDDDDDDVRKTRNQGSLPSSSRSTGGASTTTAVVGKVGDGDGDRVQGTVNQTAMLTEMERLGRGIVDRIDVFLFQPV